jgi:hypothetical protein
MQITRFTPESRQSYVDTAQKHSLPLCLNSHLIFTCVGLQKITRSFTTLPPINSNVSGGGNCEAISDGTGVSLLFSEYPWQKIDNFWAKKWLLWWLDFIPLGNFFFAVGNQICLFHNFNTAKVGVFLVWHKPHKFEMDLGRLAPASEVAGEHTIPF